VLPAAAVLPSSPSSAIGTGSSEPRPPLQAPVRAGRKQHRRQAERSLEDPPRPKDLGDVPAKLGRQRDAVPAGLVGEVRAGAEGTETDVGDAEDQQQKTHEEEQDPRDAHELHARSHRSEWSGT
jgi:hypothetical protein